MSVPTAEERSGRGGDRTRLFGPRRPGTAAHAGDREPTGARPRAERSQASDLQKGKGNPLSAADQTRADPKAEQRSRRGSQAEGRRRSRNERVQTDRSRRLEEACLPGGKPLVEERLWKGKSRSRERGAEASEGRVYVDRPSERTYCQQGLTAERPVGEKAQRRAQTGEEVPNKCYCSPSSGARTGATIPHRKSRQHVMQVCAPGLG